MIINNLSTDRFEDEFICTIRPQPNPEGTGIRVKAHFLDIRRLGLELLKGGISFSFYPEAEYPLYIFKDEDLANFIEYMGLY